MNLWPVESKTCEFRTGEYVVYNLVAFTLTCLIAGCRSSRQQSILPDFQTKALACYQLEGPFVLKRKKMDK